MPKIELLLTDISSDSLLRIEHKEETVVLIQTKGHYSAFLDRCPHANWPLSQGELNDGVLECLGHGWRFNVLTGDCITVPGCRLKLLPLTRTPNSLLIEWD